MADTNSHFEIKKRRPFVWIAVVAVIAVAVVGEFLYSKSKGPSAVVFGDTLKVHYHTSSAGEESVIKYVNEHIAPDYGIKLEAAGLTDAIQVDRAIAEGKTYAGSIGQHQWWLQQVIDVNGFELTPTVYIFQWAFGIYSDRYKSVDALPEGAVIAIPNDAANQGQALWLLQRAGLIGLNQNVEPRISKIKDIVHNPRKFQFKEIEDTTIPRVLDSIDAGVSYVSFFDAGKVPREKTILLLPPPKTFAARLVVGTKFLDDPKIIKLQQAFADPRVRKYLETTDDPLVKDIITPVSDD
ncbi:MAG: hypothetical protein LBQ18_06520 [Campylobacteraceae bacterium]|jgi:ABC-type metal ion transport system substrate-binding protein|nr:hypothetical protein [Campylobacteraceae bacterium]